jgi:HCOMODA/2-hydroxy-3-carboxy-muconic semialdehyde decarboxylase
MFPDNGITRRGFVTGSVLLAAGALLGATPFIGAQRGPASAGPANPALIEDLVAANRILAQQGVLDGFGHVSVRHDRDPNRFLLARSLAPELVTAADLLEFDLDGVPVDAKGNALYSERFIHSEIYKARPDVKAVVHNHSPAVIPFGVSSVPLRPVSHMAPFIGEKVPVFDIRQAFGITDMLVNDSAKGRELVGVLGNNTAVLMRGHGVSVVGATIPLVVGRSIYLEFNAKLQMQAMSLGGTVTYLDPGEARKMMEAGENRAYDRPWLLWKRNAMGR